MLTKYDLTDGIFTKTNNARLMKRSRFYDLYSKPLTGKGSNNIAQNKPDAKATVTKCLFNVVDKTF